MRRITRDELEIFAISSLKQHNILKDSNKVKVEEGEYDIFYFEDMIDYAMQDLKLNDEELSFYDVSKIIKFALKQVEIDDNETYNKLIKDILFYRSTWNEIHIDKSVKLEDIRVLEKELLKGMN